MTALRLVEKFGFQPPEPRRIEVRIAVSSGRLPFGRSRPFRIRETDLVELIAHAGRLEARR